MDPAGPLGAVTGLEGHTGTSSMPGVFAQIGLDYAHRYGGADFELFARIAEKNHFHSTLNPLAAHQKPMSAAQIMADVMVAYPNARPMCSANVDGAAAAVLVSGERLASLPREQQRRAVKITASVLTSDPWQESCQVLPDVSTLTKTAARKAYESAGVDPADLDLVELHDCFATAGSCTTTTSCCARKGARPTSSTPAPRGATARRRSTSPGALSPRDTPSPPPGSPTSTRSRPTCAARRRARSTAPGWA